MQVAVFYVWGVPVSLLVGCSGVRVSSRLFDVSSPQYSAACFSLLLALALCLGAGKVFILMGTSQPPKAREPETAAWPGHLGAPLPLPGCLMGAQGGGQRGGKTSYLPVLLFLTMAERRKPVFC